MTALNQDYSSVVEGSNAQLEPRLSINNRKSKPITVSFKNIVKAGIQKRKTSVAGGADESRDESE